jgi:hypothetical protein
MAYADGDGAAARQPRRAARPAARRRASPRRRRFRRAHARRACAASTRAATPFYDQISALHKSVRGSIPMPRCTGCAACSTAAPTRATSPAGSSAWRARTSASPIRARCKHRARRRGNLRAPGLAGRRTRAGRVRAVSRGRAKSNAAYLAYNAARLHRGGTARGRCRCPAQRADEAHEASATARATATRTTRRAPMPPAKPTCPRACRRSLVRPTARGLEGRRSARSSRSCASATAQATARKPEASSEP